MRLDQEFFASQVWLEPRKFSKQEAFVDLVFQWESSWDLDSVALAHRWQWTLPTVGSFIHSLQAKGILQGRRPTLSGVEANRTEDRLITELHDIYNQVFQRRLKLTRERVLAYNRLVSCGLTDDGQSVALETFRRICRQVRRDDFLMAKVAYHDPASLFRNDTRASRWLEEARDHDSVSLEQEREREIVDTFHAASPEVAAEVVAPSETSDEDVRGAFEALSTDVQVQIRKAWEIKRRQYSSFGQFQEEAERALLRRLVKEARGDS